MVAHIFILPGVCTVFASGKRKWKSCRESSGILGVFFLQLTGKERIPKPIKEERKLQDFKGK